MYFKGMSSDMTAHGGFKFEIGKEYDTGYTNITKYDLCSEKVFHFCDSMRKVHDYYSCNPTNKNRFFEIEALGEVVDNGEKMGSNKIRIVREITGDELNNLVGLINGNTGIFNTGDRNTGDRNTGDGNTGDYNTGNRNTGDRNTGDCNTGNRNTGDCNTGYYNTGDCNTGDCNTGDGNTGCRNTGYYNTGNRNTGDYNTGNCNTGDRNTGNWNRIDGSTGFFNTKPETVKIFNIDCGMTQWECKQCEWYEKLSYYSMYLTEWIEYTNEEKKADKEKELIGGYLKKHTYKEACANWWAKYSIEDKKYLVENIPNFNTEIFKEITGIDVVTEGLIKEEK